jgi:hypothetical protein
MATRVINLDLPVQVVPRIDEIALRITPTPLSVDITKIATGIQETRSRNWLAAHGGIPT